MGPGRSRPPGRAVEDPHAVQRQTGPRRRLGPGRPIDRICPGLRDRARRRRLPAVEAVRRTGLAQATGGRRLEDPPGHELLEVGHRGSVEHRPGRDAERGRLLEQLSRRQLGRVLVHRGQELVARTRSASSRPTGRRHRANPIARCVYLFAGTVPGIFAFAGFAYLGSRFGSVRSSLVVYIGPIASALLSLVLLGEGPDTVQIAGGSLILAGDVWSSLRK